MDRERIQSIIESHGVINVTHKNTPVWIESIGNKNDGMVLVRNLKTNEHYEVNIDELKE
jgi:H-type small acid-soluble spore protein